MQVLPTRRLLLLAALPCFVSVPGVRAQETRPIFNKPKDAASPGAVPVCGGASS